MKRSFMQLLSTSHQAGFTLVEILTVLTVLSILVGLVLTTLYSMYDSNISALHIANQSTDTRTALRVLEDDVNIASSFQAKVASPTSPQGASNDTSEWSFKGSGASSRVLISQAYATTSSDSGRALVYTDTSGCGSPSLTDAAKYTRIYFVSGTTLYRRTVLPTNTCAPGPFQKATCAAGQTAPICQGVDAVILRDVSSFSIAYYTDADDATPVDVYNEPNDAVATSQVAASTTIVVAIETTKTISGMIHTYQGSIRINKFNQ